MIEQEPGMWDDWEEGPGQLVTPEPTRLAVVPQPAGPPPTWRPRDLEDVLDGTYTPPVPTVGRRQDGIGLFYAGRMHSIVGESEGGKTWFALMAVASELAAGNAVVFIDFEDDAPGVVGRLLAMGADRQHIRDRFAYIRPEDPLTIGFNRQEIAQAMHDLRPTFVPIDGVTEGMAMHGMELKDNTDVAKFGRMLLRPIAELGAAVATSTTSSRTRKAAAGTPSEASTSSTASTAPCTSWRTARRSASASPAGAPSASPRTGPASCAGTRFRTAAACTGSPTSSSRATTRPSPKRPYTRPLRTTVRSVRQQS
ncbi:AAA family ATPase [Streptomyces actuosus]|nr:AAA family ATPase [Streptomyces actuosus]